MGVPARLALFATGLALVFGGAVAAGGVVDPEGDGPANSHEEESR